MSRRNTKSIRKAVEMAADLLLLRYPGFVYGRGDNANIPPVFCFHGVEPNSLDMMLNFLDENHYITLDSDEFLEILRGNSTAPDKSVVLTFDDGWGSLRTLGLPLMKKYGMKGVVFLATGLIEHARRKYPDLDDLHAGRCREEDVLHRDKSAQPFLSWEEIAEMHDSGHFDFQSHSHTHSLVCISTKPMAFVHPEIFHDVNLTEYPCPAHLPTGKNIPLVRLGEPLYTTAPRLSETRRLYIDKKVSDACVGFVRDHGGASFFRERGYKEKLYLLHSKLIKPELVCRESPEEQLEAIRFELAESKRAIETAVPGKVVRYICYPWHAAGLTALNEAAKIGYVGGFSGKVNGRYYNRISANLHEIARVGGDFFFRLPGKGRMNLFRIMINKLIRRAKEGSPYLTHQA